MALGRKTAFCLELQFANQTLSRWQGFWFVILMLMEKQPDTENVAYIDEYPHLEEKLRLQRLARPAVKAALHDMTRIVIFERPEPPDGAA